jgi:UPF0271 protein
MLLATKDSAKHTFAANSLGVDLILEAFADRQYTDEGHLVSRHLDGSVHDKPALLAQVKQLLTEGCVTTRSGNTLNLYANSLCVHGDNAAGIALIKEIKSLCASAT